MKILVCCQNCGRRLSLPARDGIWHCSRCGMQVSVRGVTFDDGTTGQAVESEVGRPEVAQTRWGPMPIGDGGNGA